MFFLGSLNILNNLKPQTRIDGTISELTRTRQPTAAAWRHRPSSSRVLEFHLRYLPLLLCVRRCVGDGGRRGVTGAGAATVTTGAGETERRPRESPWSWSWTASGEPSGGVATRPGTGSPFLILRRSCSWALRMAVCLAITYNDIIISSLKGYRFNRF